MSFFTSIKNFLVTTEQDVIKIIGAIVKEEAVLEKDLGIALKWIAGQTPTIASKLQMAESLIVAVGAANNPNVAASIAAANLAVAGLNAFAAAYNSGTPTAAAVVEGYQALKQASAAASNAAASAVSSVKV